MNGMFSIQLPFYVEMQKLIFIFSFFLVVTFLVQNFSVDYILKGRGFCH